MVAVTRDHKVLVYVPLQAETGLQRLPGLRRRYAWADEVIGIPIRKPPAPEPKMRTYRCGACSHVWESKAFMAVRGDGCPNCGRKGFVKREAGRLPSESPD